MKENNNKAKRTKGNSGDANYYARIPRMVEAMARTPYDDAFYGVVMGICGDDGECWLRTESLALLCKMSEGKVSECREYWMKLGYIVGRLVPHGARAVWHLKIVDVWSRNTEWAKTHLSIESRVEHAKSLKAQNGQGYIKNKKPCYRCGNTYIATGRRSKYCDFCGNQRHHEQSISWKLIKMPKRDYIQDKVCANCGSQDGLELHLEDETNPPMVMCLGCHDALHRNVHPMNVPADVTEPSSHECSPSSDKSSSVAHLSDERKKNQLNKEQPPRKEAATIWEEAMPKLKKHFSAADFSKYVSCQGDWPYSLREEGNKLVLMVWNSRDYDEFWSQERTQKIVLETLRNLAPDIEIDFWPINI